MKRAIMFTEEGFVLVLDSSQDDNYSGGSGGWVQGPDG